MQNNICHHIVDNNFAIYKKFVLVELWQIEKTTIIHNSFTKNIKKILKKRQLKQPELHCNINATLLLVL